MLWTKTNSLKGLNLGLMNIHRRRSLIGPLAPRGKPIGDAGAGSEEADKVKETQKTTIFPPETLRLTIINISIFQISNLNPPILEVLKKKSETIW